MARPEGVRRLIVNADDFGRSETVNEAVIQAHRRGILTSASLMVNESACEGAVALARQNPRLGVGLHLALIRGRSALSSNEIPELVNKAGEFGQAPLASGLRYFFNRRLKDQLSREIHAQFRKFHTLGIPLDHVNGHLHFHLHPVIFGIVLKHAGQLGVRRIRLTHDPFMFNCKIAKGRFAYRLAHAFVFQCLGMGAVSRLKTQGIRHTQRVFGLLQDSRVDETFVLKLLQHLPTGDSELYSHPSTEGSRHELEALISPQVREAVHRHGIELVRYQDL